MKNIGPYLLVVCAMAALVILLNLFNQESRCEMDGGKFVRGLWWYECVHEGARFGFGSVTLVAPDKHE